MQVWLFGLGLGIAYGALCGLFKYLVLWYPLLKRAVNAEKAASAIMTRSTLSMFFNVLFLFLVYYFKHSLPTEFTPTIIGAAFALALSSRLYPIKNLAAASSGSSDNILNNNDKKEE